MELHEIDLKGEICEEDGCYKEFEGGDRVGFVLTETKQAKGPNRLVLRPAHLHHLIRHSHVENVRFE